MTSDDPTDERVNRRAYLAGLSATTTAALAGCSMFDSGGSSDNSNSSSGGTNELGEEVPTLQMRYATGLGDTTQVMEDALPIVQQNVEEALGVSVEISATGPGAHVNQIMNDEREAHITQSGLALDPTRLDPDGVLSGFSIEGAGAGPPLNWLHYANCDYEELLNQQRNASSDSERRSLVHEALSVASDDILQINLFPRISYGAYRTDVVSIDDPGVAGVNSLNPDVLINADTGGETRSIAIEAEPVNTKNHLTSQNSTTAYLWNNLIYSPLVRYDRNRELTTVLAEDYSVNDDYTAVEFSLRDTTFHNGDPVTAEDVKWSHEFFASNTGTFPRAREWDFESVEAVDERTVRFSFAESTPTFLRTSAVELGILPKDVWIDGGAEDDPGNVTLDPIVGSGPYRVTSFEQGQQIRAEPFEDHWNTPSGTLLLQAYQDAQSKRRAFQNGNVAMLSQISSNLANDIRENMSDTAEVTVENGFLPYSLGPMRHFGPTKFREFCLAVSQAINRQQISQVAMHGDAEPHLYSCLFTPTHPWYPEDHEGLTQIADSPTANPETARQILADAGWGWDDNGNLHYPPDADLEPLWPQGENPDPAEYSCLE